MPTVACPSSGLTATACYALEITCPKMPDYTAYAKIVEPIHPRGTVILTTGGDGNNIYEAYTYGTVTVKTLV